MSAVRPQTLPMPFTYVCVRVCLHIRSDCHQYNSGTRQVQYNKHSVDTRVIHTFAC
jgi:hypothetical protein